MSTLGPSLQQGMEWLIVNMPLLARESENKIMEARDVNPSLDNIREAIVPRSGTTEIFNTFKSVGIELHAKQGVEIEIFLLKNEFFFRDTVKEVHTPTPRGAHLIEEACIPSQRSVCFLNQSNIKEARASSR